MQRLLVAATLSLLVACAGGACSATRGNPADRGDRAGSRPPRRDRDVLLRTELTENQQAEMTVYEAVRLYRPHMLRSSLPTTLRGTQVELAVYLDETRYGNIAVLQRFRMVSVDRVEYLSGSEATTRFGTNHGAGVIIIRLRR